MPEYTVTVDRDACDGVFACLVRDPRFVEDAAGLAAFEPGAATTTSEEGTDLVAGFDDDRRDDAEQAAAACPLDAITVADGNPDEHADAVEASDREAQP